MRGSISPPALLDDDDCLVAEIEPLSDSRRESITQLHHPKSLKRSPKSAYFQDGFILEGQLRRDSNTLVLEDLPIRRDSTALMFGDMPMRQLFEAAPPSPPARYDVPETPLSEGEQFVDARETLSEDSDGGVAVPPSPIAQKHQLQGTDDATSISSDEATGDSPTLNPTKHRVFGKSGKELTPWPTPRARSHDASHLSTSPSTENLRDPDQQLNTEAFARAFDDRVSTFRRASLPFPSATSTRITRSYSESRHRPQGLPQVHTDEQDKDTPRASTSTAERVVVIHTTPATPATPSKALPVLNVIPATPMPLSPVAEKDKQLTVRSLLRRHPTGIASSPVAEDTPAVSLPPPPLSNARPRRPSLSAIPQKIHESKLHPWWRPKSMRVPADADDVLTRVASAPDSVGECAEQEPTLRRSESLHSIETRRRDPSVKRGRVQKRIKGTKLVVEFIGWRGIGEAIRRPLKGMRQRTR